MGDVGRLAGVSHQTVSRVLNGQAGVAEETRARVLAAIESLGYRRNTAARALVTRRSGTIGVIASGSALFGPTSTLIAVERAAREAGLFVSVATVPRWDGPGLGRGLEHFLAQGVEGVVVVAAHDRAVDAVRAFAAPVPVVMVGPTQPDGDLPSVAVDQVAGARLATEHLLALGHADVLHLAGPPDWIDARERAVGWRRALVAAGVRPRPPVVGDWRAGTGYRAGRELLAGGVLPTAVLAGNDELALGLLRAFAEAGVRVPDDVSVVGFDDIDGAAHFFPPLTTVRQPFGELGRQCLALLVELLAGRPAAPALIAPTLVERGSTAAPRERAAVGSRGGTMGPLPATTGVPSPAQPAAGVAALVEPSLTGDM